MSNPFDEVGLTSAPLNMGSSLDWSSPLKTPIKSVKSPNKSDGQSGDDIVNSILQERSARSQKYPNNPYNIGSSPLSSKDRSLSKTSKKQKAQRIEERERRLLENRGGLDKMEEFVMRGERKRELDDMAKLASEYAIPEDVVDSFEEEYQCERSVDFFNEKENGLIFQNQSNQYPGKEEESSDDDDLIKYFENKEKYERELEQLLSELSMN